MTEFLAAIDTGSKDIAYMENEKQIKFYITRDMTLMDKNTFAGIRSVLCRRMSSAILN